MAKRGFRTFRLILAGWMLAASNATPAAALGPTVGGSLGLDWLDESDLYSGDLGLRIRLGDPARRNHFRVALVYTEGRIDEDPELGDSHRFQGYAFTGAVAWPMGRRPGMDLWIAPGVHLSSVEFRKDDIRATGYGLAVAVGADYHLGPSQTAVIEAGLRHVCLIAEGTAISGVETDHDLVEFIAGISLLWGR